jgi:hypothetical protein
LYILVVETGEGAVRGLPSGEAGFESSLLWETCLLDVFFDAGHIVSNAPVLRLEAPGNGEFPAELEPELEEARSGGADYVILALLRYPVASDRKARPEWAGLRLYDLRPYRLVHERSLALIPTGRSAARPESETAQAVGFIRGLVPHLEG